MTERRVGILTTDVDLVVTSWDAALASMTGISPDRAVGRPITEVVPDLESRGILGLVREPLEAGAPRVLAAALHGYLIPCPPRAPSTRFAQMQQRVVLGALQEESRIVGLVATVEDVTERLEREHELAEELRHASPAVRSRTIKRLSSHEPVDGVGPLSQAMGDEDWRVRRDAIDALANRRDPALVSALVDALRGGHRNFNVLSSAQTLLTMTGLDLTDALSELLRHEDPDLRTQAALALGTQTGAGAEAALLEALDDADANVRFHAIEALGRLGPPSAVGRLAAIAESHDFFLAFPALDALSRINDPAVAPRIVPLLADDLIGDQAAEALGQIGDEDVVPPLAAALDREGSSVTSIATALVTIHRRYDAMPGGGCQIEDLARRSISPTGARRVIDAAPDVTSASLRELVVLLGWLEGDGVERALTLMLGRASVHGEVIEAIVRYGAPMVARLVERLDDGDVETRRIAAVALGRIGDVRAVPALIRALVSDRRELLVPVAGALARLGDRRAFEPLLPLLGDGDVSVRQAAIGALNSIGHPWMAARVGGMLGDPDAIVRESAVRIAGYFGYRECADALIARCADSDERVRAAALEHIAFLDDERCLAVLTGALESDTPRPRAAAAQAFAHIESRAALASLRRATSDADPWVRYFSVSSLGRQMDRAALPLLASLATGDALEPVRIASVEAIGRIGGDEAVGTLTALSASEARDVALAAIHALGHVDALTAFEPLRLALANGEAPRRMAAAEALAQWGRAEAVDPLAWTAAADPEPAVWRAAVGGLGRLGASNAAAAADAMCALAAVAADPVRRPDVIAALAQNDATAIDRVGACLSSRDPHVRCAVLDALGRLPHPTASAYVRSALDDGDAAVRQQAIVVLSRLGTRGLTRTFSEMMKNDSSERVRRAASAALQRRRREAGAETEHGARS